MAIAGQLYFFFNNETSVSAMSRRWLRICRYILDENEKILFNFIIRKYGVRM
jgi:hypothetical protein